MQKQKKRNNVAIYCRLSVDDGIDQTSQSIDNQKRILTKYCIDNGFNIFNVYIDDGFSGTMFDRPGLIKLKNDIESGFIDIVVTKDLSRLGRDHIEIGIFLERYFPDNNIRYIAVNDNVDTINELDDYVPIKSIVNELYAKDISKKIRATQKYQRETGKFTKTGIPLYGYTLTDTKRIINPETAPVVAKIFELYSKGYSQGGIAKYLANNHILTPTSYILKEQGKPLQDNPYKWSVQTITLILKNKEYLGHYIKGKTSKRFKSKKVYRVPEDNQFLFKNVFDPIINEETFNVVQKMFTGSRNNTSLINPYNKLVYCGICGNPLRFIRHKSGSGHYEERLYCKNKNEYGKASILLNDLNEVIKKEFFSLKNIILNHKEEFINLAKERLNNCNLTKANNEFQIKLDMTNKRIKEIDNYIFKLFNQYEEGLILKDTYQKIIEEYNNEKEILLKEKNKYELLLENDEADSSIDDEIESFINTIDEMDENNYLLPYIVRNIISKIIITTFKDENNKSSLRKEIIIYYKLSDNLIKDFINEGKE